MAECDANGSVVLGVELGRSAGCRRPERGAGLQVRVRVGFGVCDNGSVNTRQDCEGELPILEGENPGKCAAEPNADFENHGFRCVAPLSHTIRCKKRFAGE